MDSRGTSFFDAEAEEEAAVEETEVGSAKCLVLDSDGAQPVCAVCHGKLDKFWDEDSEDWMYKSALRSEGQLYHSSCFQERNKV